MALGGGGASPTRFTAAFFALDGGAPLGPVDLVFAGIGFPVAAAGAAAAAGPGAAWAAGPPPRARTSDRAIELFIEVQVRQSGLQGYRRVCGSASPARVVGRVGLEPERVHLMEGHRSEALRRTRATATCSTSSWA